MIHSHKYHTATDVPEIIPSIPAISTPFYPSFILPSKYPVSQPLALPHSSRDFFGSRFLPAFFISSRTPWAHLHFQQNIDVHVIKHEICVPDDMNNASCCLNKYSMVFFLFYETPLCALLR